MTTAQEKLIAAVHEYLATRKIPGDLVMYVKVGPAGVVHVELLDDGKWVKEVGDE